MFVNNLFVTFNIPIRQLKKSKLKEHLNCFNQKLWTQIESLGKLI